MKMLITERQLLSILKKKKQMKKDIDETIDTSASATPSTASTPLTKASGTEPTSSSAGSTSTSTDDIGSSPSAEDMPPYPEVGHWQSGLVRGAANQIATNSKWSDVVGTKLTRGHANPLK
jgi:hypothetical protein